MNSFDVAELRREGFSLIPLPDEDGRIIDATTLPATIAARVHDEDGVDISQPVRMVGDLTTSSTGAPGRYVIRFVQA
jgi:hypothetical protein